MKLDQNLRKNKLRTVLLIAIGMIACGFSPLTANAKDNGQKAGGKNKSSLVGSWYGTFFGTPVIGNFHSDGTFSAYNSHSLGQDGVQRSPINGIWVKTGPRSFEFRGIVFSLDLDGNLVAVVEGGGPATLSKDGMNLYLENTPKVFFCTANDDCPNPLVDDPDFIIPEPIPVELHRITIP